MLDNVVKSITYTIGVPFEIISIENSTRRYGICAAYNIGAARAKYDIYCFMHEDISFDTYGWGEKVIAHLQHPRVGLIGLAGGDSKSYVPSPWASVVSYNEGNFIQHFKDPLTPPQKIYGTCSPEDDSIIKNVVCVDGFWMCTKKEVFAKYQFDEKIFTGFHGYDIDFSLQVVQEYEVAVVFDILVHHYSDGNFDRTWLRNAMLVSDKWESSLPKSVRHVSEEKLLHEHWLTLKSFIDKLIQLNYSLPVICIFYFKYSFKKLFYWKHFLYFFKYIFLEYLKKDKLRKEPVKFEKAADQ